MKRSKLQPILVLVLVAAISSVTQFEEKGIGVHLVGENNGTTHLSSPHPGENHSPIYIDGNASLATFIGDEGLSGDGTYESPYIIENFTIDASTANGIAIFNTKAYLIIRNCTVSNGSIPGTYGMYLSNVTNVNITDNELNWNYNGIPRSFIDFLFLFHVKSPKSYNDL